MFSIITGSDSSQATKLPLVGGHEGAGIVVARGNLVTDVEIGDYAGKSLFRSNAGIS